jgi:hypothetical protein
VVECARWEVCCARFGSETDSFDPHVTDAKVDCRKIFTAVVMVEPYERSQSALRHVTDPSNRLRTGLFTHDGKLACDGIRRTGGGEFAFLVAYMDSDWTC